VTPHQWESVEQQFRALMEGSAQDRAEGLAAIEDPVVRAEVASLLSRVDGDSTVDGVLESIVVAIGGEFSKDQEPVAGRKIGPYRLQRLLGHGGQGAVFEAVRDDGTFHQRVAIKIIKGEMDSPAERERFRRERQVLAALEHPNIARLLDGGETPEGSPYIVMEYIEGSPITVATEGWSLRRKLQLFLDVAGAVAFAHRNLIVHRDLKPGNILVTPAGAPKLLDFGVAKLLDSDAQRTATMFQAFTPNYASPEQVTGETITTACDVYSLGMVLHELLTGARPYEITSLSPTEVHKSVCLSTPKSPGVSEDLDNIILMAIRKEPARRYASVEQFAQDISRSLANRPVLARPDTIRYRAQKFVNRNRVSVSATVLVIASIAAGFITTLRAERRERARFNQVRQLATRFLFDFDRDIRQLPGSTAAREHLVQTAFEQLDNLSRDAGNEPDFVAELAQAYMSLGDVVGMPGLPSLGHTERAEQSYRKACALMQRLVTGNSSASDRFRAQACASHIRLGYLLKMTGRAPEARKLIAEGLGYVQPRIASGKASAAEFRAAANGHTYLSTLESTAYHARAASEESAQAVALMRRYQEMTPGVRPRSDLARALAASSQAATSAGEIERAEALAQESAAIRMTIARESPRDVENRRETAVQKGAIALLEFEPDGPSLGRLDKALPARREATQIDRELVEADPRNAEAKHDLALDLKEVADLEKLSNPRLAEAELREGLDLLESLPPTYRERNRHIGLLLAVLSGVLKQEHRAADAQAALRRAVPMYAKEDPADPRVLGDLQRLWEEQGEYARIWDALSPSIPAAREDIMAAYNLAHCALARAASEIRSGRQDAASEWSARATRIWEPWKGRYPIADRQLDSLMPIR